MHFTVGIGIDFGAVVTALPRVWPKGVRRRASPRTRFSHDAPGRPSSAEVRIARSQRNEGAHAHTQGSVNSTLRNDSARYLLHLAQGTGLGPPSSRVTATPTPQLWNRFNRSLLCVLEKEVPTLFHKLNDVEIKLAKFLEKAFQSGVDLDLGSREIRFAEEFVSDPRTDGAGSSPDLDDKRREIFVNAVP